MTGGQFHDERVGQAGEGVVDRIADMAMVDVAAIGPRNELDDLACVERPIDGFECAGIGRSLLGDG